jgi:predicted enzyme related to lactoylglutathione lyase
MSPDVDASAAFYTGVFGWTADDQFDDDGNRVYVTFSVDGKAVAGLGGAPPEGDPMPAIWNTYICADDVEAIAERVVAAGGSVFMPPMQVMTAGHMAMFADPTGAMFSVWQPGDHRGAGIANEPNTWSWNELLTRDVDAAKPFYTAVFGWEYDEMPMDTGGTYCVIRGGEHGGWGGVLPMPESLPDMVPNHWMVYFMTSDTQATADAVTAHGGMVGQEPFDVPGVGRIAVFHDPQGGSFATLQPAA